MRILFLLFIVVPLLEIVTFGLVVGWLGFWIAFLLMVLTSAAGFLMVRHEGFGMAAKMARMARTGMPPESGLGKNAMTMVSGLLLLLPGFLTDLVGLLLLIPFLRRAIAGTPVMRTRFHSSSTTYSETYSYGSGTVSVVDLAEGEFSRDGTSPPENRKGPGEIGPR